MKILYLLPPSEGKNAGGIQEVEKLSFSFKKPVEIAVNATEKDLKCSGKRYEEGIELNKKVCAGEPHLGISSPQGEESYQKTAASFSSEEKEFKIEVSGEKKLVLSAISRYSGVMYSAINFDKMSEAGKKYFSENFFILSGMYGILRPKDMIGNYKLPIETKGLLQFWDTKITDTLNKLEPDIIVDLLPESYKKMLDWNNLEAKILRVAFFQKKNGERKKMTHGVKKVKGEWIYELCEKGGIEIPDFGEEKEQVLEIDMK